MPRFPVSLGFVLAASGLLGACTPAASATPLGFGPLALAEQKEAAAEASRRGHAPARTPRTRPASSAAEQPLARADEPAASSSSDDAEDEPEPSGATSASGAAPAFEGMFAGDDIAVFRLSGFPEREERDDKAKIRIEKSSDSSLSITLINSADGSDLCQLVARIDGNAALIESAQPCFSDGSEGSLEAELTSGRAVLDGDRLRMDAEGRLSVALPDQELDGELTYTFKGKRQ